LSRNEALRMRIPPGGAGAPARALSGADIGVSLKKDELDFEAADLAVTDDGPRWAGMQDLGTVGFDVTPAASRGGFRFAYCDRAYIRRRPAEPF
jgi:hypothetical protein